MRTRFWVQVIIVVIVVMTLVLAAAPAAHARDLWNWLFGCDGLFPISCPGPVIW